MGCGLLSAGGEIPVDKSKRFTENPGNEAEAYEESSFISNLILASVN